MAKPTISDYDLEFIADLLKERIYAAFALIAVLATIDADHTSPLHAAIIIAATITSLWAASIVATIMSRRIVFKAELDHRHEVRRQLYIHAPMLLSLILPLLLLLVVEFGSLPLNWALNISILSTVALMIRWSISSAQTLHTRVLPTTILVIAQLLIGLGVVGLKILAGH